MLTDTTDQSADTSSDEAQVWPKDRRYPSNRHGNIARNLKTRPNASDGFYLCALIPMAYMSQYLSHSLDSVEPIYRVLTVASLGMCTQSLCFFIYLIFDSAVHVKLVISLLPALLTSALYMYVLELSWQFGLFWGFTITFCYQKIYIRVMHGLPYCFSVGEASVLVQGVVMFLLNAALQLPKTFGTRLTNDFDNLSAIMTSALCCLFIVCCLLTQFKWLCSPLAFYPLMVLLVAAVTCLPATDPLPIIALFQFITNDNHRIYIIVFYLMLTAATVATVSWQLRDDSQKASTRMRKMFHLLIVLVYVPGMMYQCELLYISSGVALAIFTVLELFRVLHIPPLASVLRLAFATFSDEKDAGMLALTPFCLLIGCSLPLWINPRPCDSGSARLVPLMAGILTVGVGDAAASVVGSKYGSTKWRGSSRSLEGTLAFVASIFLVLCAMLATHLITLTKVQWFGITAATMISALFEAYTDQIDNLVLPLIFYTICNATT